MDYLHWLAHQVAFVVRANRSWMTWNLLLAVLPALLAVSLFLPTHRRTPAWWCRCAVFAAFLPNAPYVVTDLIHLRGDVSAAPSRGVVLAGILPLYAGFILAGFLAYLVSTELILREVRSLRPGWSRLPVELAIHLVCAVGVVLGRIARLNSWDTITSPRWTIESIFTTLTWRGAPVAVVAVFVAIVLTHGVTRSLVLSVGAGARRATRMLRPLPAEA